MKTFLSKKIYIVIIIFYSWL